jgi:hypothetical protein
VNADGGGAAMPCCRWRTRPGSRPPPPAQDHDQTAFGVFKRERLRDFRYHRHLGFDPELLGLDLAERVRASARGTGTEIRCVKCRVPQRFALAKREPRRSGEGRSECVQEVSQDLVEPFGAFHVGVVGGAFDDGGRAGADQGDEPFGQFEVVG